MLIKGWPFYDSDETEITNLSEHFEIYLVVFEPTFLFMGIGKKWHKVICFKKLKVMQPQPNIKPEILQKWLKRLLRDINWSQKQIGILKCYLIKLQAP